MELRTNRSLRRYVLRLSLFLSLLSSLQLLVDAGLEPLIAPHAKDDLHQRYGPLNATKQRVPYRWRTRCRRATSRWVKRSPVQDARIRVHTEYRPPYQTLPSSDVRHNNPRRRTCVEGTGQERGQEGPGCPRETREKAREAAICRRGEPEATSSGARASQQHRCVRGSVPPPSDPDHHCQQRHQTRRRAPERHPRQSLREDPSAEGAETCHVHHSYGRLRSPTMRA